LEGIPFRDAYKKVAEMIEKGHFAPDKKVVHTHEGSIGNLCNDKIAEKKKTIIEKFEFEKIQEAYTELLK